jgi:hypothetical protein
MTFARGGCSAVSREDGPKGHGTLDDKEDGCVHVGSCPGA